MQVYDKSCRVVFIPPGAGPRVLFGKNDVGELVHVLDADRGLACNLICPDCEGRLVANKGAIKSAHFSHHQSRIDCEHAGETALHLMAKEIIEEQGSLHLPEVSIWRFREGYEVLQPAMEVQFTRVEVEPKQDRFQPDLIGIKEIKKDGRLITARLHIEIFVTHKVDDRKLKIFKDLKEAAIEIDLSGVQRAITREELSEVLRCAENKEWLYHKKLQSALEVDAERDKAKRNEMFARGERKAQRTASILLNQENSLSTPPSPITKSQRKLVEAEWKNWHSLGLDAILDAPANDRYFSVQDRVWRTVAFTSIAPWCANAKGWLADGRKDDLPGAISSDFRRLGWIKGPFSSLDLKRFCNRRRMLVPWDPAADQIRALFGGLIKRHGYPTDWMEGYCLEMITRSIAEKYEAHLNVGNKRSRPVRRLTPLRSRGKASQAPL